MSSRLTLVLIVVPFVAWYGYRAVRALRTGIYDSLGGKVQRESDPADFWTGVIRQLFMMSVMLIAAAAWLLGPGDTRIWIAFGIAILLFLVGTILALRRHRRF